MTSGGPIRSTEFYVLYLYDNGFRYFRMGYASAMAWILFGVVVVVTVILFRTSARWVYYGGEGVGHAAGGRFLWYVSGAELWS